MFEFVEPNLQGARGLCVMAAKPCVPIVVHPLEMYRVDRVLLALEPITRHVRDHDLAEAVCEGERLPYWQFGRRLRPHIGPQQAGQFAHRIRNRSTAVAALRAGIGNVFVGLLDALSALVEFPAVIEAADTVFLDGTVGQIGATMWTVPGDQPVATGEILVECQILAEETHRFSRLLRKLACA